MIRINHFRGVIAVIIAFVVFGVTITPDGPFKRPHPGLIHLFTWKIASDLNCLLIMMSKSLRSFFKLSKFNSKFAKVLFICIKIS